MPTCVTHVFMKGKKTVILSIRVDETVGNAIRDLAADEDRTVSKYLERLVRQHVAEKLGPPAKPKKERGTK